MEEREAAIIQNRLAEQLKESDFSLDVFTTNKKSLEVSKTEERKIKEQIKRDLTQLSKRQKLELLEKESPEFLSLLDLFKGYLIKLNNFLQPVRNLIDDGSIPQCPASQCIKIYHELVINYCMNLGFYFLLKARHMPVQAHPVVGRLVQYRQLINELEQCLPNEMHQQVDMILNTVSQTPTEKPKKQLLQLLRTTAAMPTMDSSEDEAPRELNQGTVDSDESHEEEHDKTEIADEDSLGKRAITYQIAKNKGLTPYRKKELRNPRVKHRMKFRKAKIRRKGQVREARTELQKYGGEQSGIKTTVSKSVKIK
ncbi:hypothetical protein B566_EDAN008118 [Ephemera danica]|nr:hypothetical protein B566_EDAN008118 [Ephemera danica]